MVSALVFQFSSDYSEGTSMGFLISPKISAALIHFVKASKLGP